MKNKKLLYGIPALLILIAASVFVWNNYRIQITERTDKPIQLPPQISGKCGIENCHGLDITCGPNVAEICTEIYMAGDNCRQYAACQSVSGQCTLQKSPKFTACKSCVEKCQTENKENPMEFFQCESKCTT